MRIILQRKLREPSRSDKRQTWRHAARARDYNIGLAALPGRKANELLPVAAFEESLADRLLADILLEKKQKGHPDSIAPSAR